MYNGGAFAFPSHPHHGSLCLGHVTFGSYFLHLSPSLPLPPSRALIRELIFLNSAHQARIPSRPPWIITGEQSGYSKAGKMHPNDPVATAICCPSQRDDPWLQNSHEYLAPGFAPLPETPKGHVLLLLDSWKWIPGEIISSNSAGTNRGPVDRVNNIVDNSRSRLWRK